jgi:hypothetical protein
VPMLRTAQQGRPKVVKRRLYRPQIYRQLEKIRHQYFKLSYPLFLIKAFKTINPDWSIDPDKNFSRMESVRGYLGRLYIDPVSGLVNYRSMNWADKERRAFNELIENHTAQIYRVEVKQNEFVEGNRRRKETIKTVLHDYLRPVRGKDDVNQIDAFVTKEMDGLQELKDRIHHCDRPRSVDKRIAEILEECDRIQNGGEE